MPRTVRSGRNEHEIVEIPPDMLDCGHPYGPRRVTLGFEEHPQHPDQRVRTYYCRECRTITYCDPPEDRRV
jgi:hypothetical protein